MRSLRKNAILNRYIGWLVFGLVGIIVAINAGLFVFTEDSPVGRQFVAYVDFGAGLSTGNLVFMDGQSIGKVVEADFVNEDGKTKIRLMIEVNAQHSELEIPRDSIFVVNKAGVLGDPSVEIKYGKSKAELEIGGKFENTKSPSSISMIEEGGMKIFSARDAVDKLVTSIIDDKYVEVVVDKLAEIKISITEVEGQLADASEDFKQIGEAVPEALESIRSLRKSLSERSVGVEDNLKLLVQDSSDADAKMNSLATSIANFQSTLDSWNTIVKRAADGSDKSELQKLLRDVRWQSAELAAMGEAIKRDPSNTSGGENRREVAKKFNAKNNPLGRFGGTTRIGITE